MRTSQKIEQLSRVVEGLDLSGGSVEDLELLELTDKDGDPVFINPNVRIIGALEKDKGGRTKIHLVGGDKIVVQGTPAAVKAILEV